MLLCGNSPGEVGSQQQAYPRQTTTIVVVLMQVGGVDARVAAMNRISTYQVSRSTAALGNDLALDLQTH